MSDLPIPTEAWQAAMKTYHREVRRNPGNAWQAAIRAGIEAWPGKSRDRDSQAWRGCKTEVLILPLQKGARP